MPLFCKVHIEYENNKRFVARARERDRKGEKKEQYIVQTQKLWALFTWNMIIEIHGIIKD